MLGRKRHANLVEFMNFLARSRQPLVDFMAAMDKMNVVQGIVYHAVEQSLRHIRREIRIDGAVIAGISKVVVGQRQNADIRHAKLRVMPVQQVLLGKDDYALDFRVFRYCLLETEPPKSLHFMEVSRCHGIIVKKSDDREGPHPQDRASFWRNSSAHESDVRR